MDDFPMMMEWFGTSWRAPLNESCPQTLVPVGRECFWCHEAVAADDSGVIQSVVGKDLSHERLPLHLECFLRQSIGSYGHVTGQCSCYGGDVDDPPGMTVREAARAALKAFNERYEVDVGE